MVEGNKIIRSNGREVLLKGIWINSPGILMDEGHDFLQDIREIKKLGANAVQVPICPAYWQYVDDYCSEILDSIVDLSEELGLYCSLDWHAQGNPSNDETRELGNELIHGFEKYDASKKVALEALEKLSKRYGKRSHVMFNPFSMPMDIENKDWVKTARAFVDKLRENTENIIIINGTNWSSDLSWVLENPIKSKNIVYGFIFYPLEKYQDLSSVKKVKKKYPVILPECGYTLDGYFKGTKKDYAMKLKKLVKKNSVGFFAWVYHPKRVPVILNSWNPKDLTEWGLFLKEELL